MAKRKIKTLAIITPGATALDPMFVENLDAKGGNLVRITASFATATNLTMSSNADAGSPIYSDLNTADPLVANAEYVFESGLTGANILNFKSTVSIIVKKFIVELFLEQ